MADQQHEEQYEGQEDVQGEQGDEAGEEPEAPTPTPRRRSPPPSDEDGADEDEAAEDAEPEEDDDLDAEEELEADEDDEDEEIDEEGEGEPENWFAMLDEDERQRALDWHEQRSQPLRAAIERERKQRKDDRKELRQQISQLSKQLEGGTEAQQSLSKQLKDLNTQLQRTERRATFMEQAPAQRVVPSLLEPAWLAVQENDLIDKRTGAIKWDELKSRYPDMFEQRKRKPAPPANAGNGVNRPRQPQFASSGEMMDAMLRGRTGR
jgi:hypothetical protein